MIITLKKDATQIEVQHLVDYIEEKGLKTQVIVGANQTVLGMIGDTTVIDEDVLRGIHCISDVTRIAAPYKRVSKAFHPQDTVVKVGDYKIGGSEKIVMIGGPCSVEEEESFMTSAKGVKAAGGNMLRGGAFKPRTSPYAFQGRGSEGIHTLCHAKKELNMPIVTEIMNANRIQEFLDHNVDIIQVGARNMQNFDLLKALGKIQTPILLKRGLANTIEEWLMSAEYIMAGGNPNVILCERGIRTFEKYTRNTLDLSVIPIVKQKTHLPIIIDPSHATGDWKLVEAMSLAAIAAGADGLIVEVHHDPVHAWSDGAQCLTPENYKHMIEKARAIAKVIGRDIY
jgi:3-deoxy-7-phosphoheptulonate synthase